MASEFQFEGRGMEDLARNLQKAARDFQAEVQKSLLKNAEEVAETARNLASANGSATIPGTIHVLPVARGAVVIRAGAEGHPLAKLWEIGNRKSRRSETTFRHPVYARKGTPRSQWTWVEQPKHPFLRPAIRIDRAKYKANMRQAWDRAFATTGIRTRWEG